MKLRILLTALALIVLGTAGLRGTTAAFTASETTTIEISTASLGIDRSGDGLVFDSAPLAPGGISSTSVRVTNDSALAAELTLTREEMSSDTPPEGCAVREALELKVIEDVDGDPATIDDREKLTDELIDDAPGELALGRFAAREARTYEVTLTFVAQNGATTEDNDNCFQGSSTTERFAWQSMEAQS
jgi:hypothetical protein